MKAQDVMIRDVRTCGPETDLQALAAAMWDCDCGAVPVVEPDGRLMGIVTDRDVAITAALQHKPLWELKAREVIDHREMATCREGDDIDAVLSTMASHHVRRLPVVDEGGHVRGILSIDDLLVRAGGDSGPSVQAVAGSLKRIVQEPVVRHHGPAESGGGEKAGDTTPALSDSANELISAFGSVARAGSHLAAGVADRVAGIVGSFMKR